MPKGRKIKTPYICPTITEEIHIGEEIDPEDRNRCGDTHYRPNRFLLENLLEKIWAAGYTEKDQICIDACVHHGTNEGYLYISITKPKSTEQIEKETQEAIVKENKARQKASERKRKKEEKAVLKAAAVLKLTKEQREVLGIK